VLGAAVHLEGLLRDSPAAALGCAGSGQQTVDHAFQSEPFPPEVARVDVLDVLAAFRINLEAGYLTGFVVDDLVGGLSFRVYTKGRKTPRFLGTIRNSVTLIHADPFLRKPGKATAPTVTPTEPPTAPTGGGFLLASSQFLDVI
jgi:hypothetical protein